MPPISRRGLASGATRKRRPQRRRSSTLAAFKYARFARGGRLDPVALSNILDMKPPVKDAKTVRYGAGARCTDPAAYLRGINPKHVGFEQLRQALLKARGPRQEEEAIDPALLVNLPARQAAETRRGRRSGRATAPALENPGRKFG